MLCRANNVTYIEAEIWCKMTEATTVREVFANMVAAHNYFFPEDI